MLLENIHGVIRRIDYTLTDADIDIWAQQCILAVENETFDFSTKVKEVLHKAEKDGLFTIILNYRLKILFVII